MPEVLCLANLCQPPSGHGSVQQSERGGTLDMPAPPRCFVCDQSCAAPWSILIVGLAVSGGRSLGASLNAILASSSEGRQSSRAAILYGAPAQCPGVCQTGKWTTLIGVSSTATSNF